ncbi:hypothetical protein BDN72DRAFT_782628, partial [Pluteus cervinus]
MSCLEVKGITRLERKSEDCLIKEIVGPVIDSNCSHVCLTCRQSLYKNKIPKLALANGLWIGEVPDILKDLTFFEKMLIARVRLHRCFVRVSSGFRKMISHAIAFEAPTARLYQELPPPREDMDDVLAILFTGPAQPTDEDFARTPLLVRRNKVIQALKWLKINHKDYADIVISQNNIDEYPE